MTDIMFPQPRDTNMNMMPIMFGHHNTLPNFARDYLPMIERCAFERGDVVYLTVTESLVKKGVTQRRPGIHTDGTHSIGWGGSPWGGAGGIYFASTDGACRVWDCDVEPECVGDQGQLLAEPDGSASRCAPSRLYQMSDYTPHESLPADTDHYRQFFRLVGPGIGAWFYKHSTPNPMGLAPRAHVVYASKF